MGRTRHEKPKRVETWFGKLLLLLLSNGKTLPLKNSDTNKGRKQVGWIPGRLEKVIDEHSITSSPPRSAATLRRSELDRKAQTEATRLPEHQPQ